jgi:predicted membrane protein
MFDGGLFAIVGAGAGLTLAIFIFWSLIWKGLALWASAKEDKKWWFLAILVLNTAGILEIVYLLGFSSTGKTWLANQREKMKARKEVKETEAKEVKDDDDDKDDDDKDCECDDCDCDECECECHKKD